MTSAGRPDAWRDADAQERPVAWVTLDEGDNDAVVLWSQVIEALGRACPALAEAISAELVPAAPLLEVTLPRLVNELAEQGEIVLVFDDFHRLTSAASRESLAWFVDSMPSTLQLVLSTRADPALPLGALRAHGQLLELRADALRFTGPEAHEFLNGRLGLGQAGADVDLLVTRTEGWPAWHDAYGTTDEAIHHAVAAHAFAEAGSLIAESWVHYELVLRGEIGDRFGLLFEGMELSRTPGHTVLTGAVIDEAHLHGLIERIQELGIELVSVNPLPRKGPRMTNTPSTPDTIVLIHGFWVTPRSWEHWVAHYDATGFKVLAPAYPGFEVEVEALNADTSPIEAVTVPQIIEHLEAVIGALESPPILIGHSAGGVFTQILLDHGFGAAGVAINSAPTEGVKRVPLSQVKATFPMLKNPANRHRAVGFTHEQWHYAFTNGFSEEESRALYERYHVPASGAIFWGSALANVHPGHDDSYVNYANDDRAPLLFISGSDDNLMPPSLQRSNAKHYRSEHTLTEVKEFAGPHLLPAREGWEEVADYALEWALDHARTGAPQGA